MNDAPATDAPATDSPVTFAGLWRTAVEQYGDRPFLRFEASTGVVTEWTYADFDDLVRRACHRFVAAGVTAERGVHVALTNSPSFVAAWLAANQLGSWIVPSDPMSTAPELREHLSRTRPALSIASDDRADVAHDAIDGLDPAAELLVVGEDDATLGALTVESGEPALEAADLPVPSPTDRAAIMFTSGTTGRPKGVVVTQANYAFAGTTMAAAAELGAGDRQLVVLPLFHANAQYYSFAPAIAVGASVALMHTFSASGFLRQAVDHDATHASLFAGPMRMILARAEPDPDRALRLRHCWFAQNLADDQYETLTHWLGCRPRQLYGMTETIPAVLTDDAHDPRPDAMGRVTPGCSVEVHDERGAQVPDGSVGEIVVGGTPALTLFGGYLDDPVTTAASYRHGWFLTGDRARVAADGRFEFDGRRADVLKVAGENVSVVEVEAVVGAHPAVFDVVVVGAPDPVREEVPVAFVVPADAVALGDPDECDRLTAMLDDWCTGQLSKSKRPRRFTFVADLPRTSVGKIRKFLLADAASASAEPAREESIR
ncbi:MAG: AMP-binding protein [Actinomycetota bacterium]